MSDPSSILLIEDDPSVARSIVEYFSDLGVQCASVANGAKGLEVFRRKLPQVLLVDLRTPGLGGLEVLREVRASNPETPVIVISGSRTMDDVVQALRLGAWDYLVKPIADMAILDHAVKRSLERARLLRENRLHKERLEEQVRERTAQLSEANEALEQKNVALREVLRSIQEEKNSVAESVVTNTERVIAPMLANLKLVVGPKPQRLIGEIETAVASIVSPFADKLSKDLARLSPTELRIATMIRRGLSMKEVAALEHISPETVATHRRAIRRKLGITNSKLNLTTYLEARFGDMEAPSGAGAGPSTRAVSGLRRA